MMYYLNWLWTLAFVFYNIVFFSFLKNIQTFKLAYQVIVWLTLLLIWLVLVFFSFGAGYPNNKPNKIIHLDSTRNKNKSLTFYVKELEKSKWQIFDDFHNEIFDMKGWIKQKSFITMLIRTKIMLDIYNRDMPKHYALYFGNQYSTIKDVCLIFISLHGRESKKQIIKNHKVIKSFYLRLKSYSINLHTHGKHKYIKYTLKDYYFIKNKHNIR